MITIRVGEGAPAQPAPPPTAIPPVITHQHPRHTASRGRAEGRSTPAMMLDLAPPRSTFMLRSRPWFGVSPAARVARAGVSSCTGNHGPMRRGNPAERPTIQLTDVDHPAATRPLAPTDDRPVDRTSTTRGPLDERTVIDELWRISHFGRIPEGAIRRALMLARDQEVPTDGLHRGTRQLLARGWVEHRNGGTGKNRVASRKRRLLRRVLGAIAARFEQLRFRIAGWKRSFRDFCVPGAGPGCILTAGLFRFRRFSELSRRLVCGW